MKINYFLIAIIFSFLLSKTIFANEINIISDNIKILENGKKIKSTNTKVIVEK